MSPKNLGQQAPAHLAEAILTGKVGLRREQREIDDFVEPEADFRTTRLLPSAPLVRASPGNPTSFLQQWHLSRSGISYTPLPSDHISGAARREPTKLPRKARQQAGILEKAAFGSDLGAPPPRSPFLRKKALSPNAPILSPPVRPLHKQPLSDSIHHCFMYSGIGLVA